MPQDRASEVARNQYRVAFRPSKNNDPSHTIAICFWCGCPASSDPPHSKNGVVHLGRSFEMPKDLQAAHAVR